MKGAPKKEEPGAHQTAGAVPAVDAAAVRDAAWQELMDADGNLQPTVRRRTPGSDAWPCWS